MSDSAAVSKELPACTRGLTAGATVATVLLVDDDEAVTETFVRMLRLEGYEICSANTAAAGLHLAELRRPDVIILDLRMPIMDGLGFLRHLRRLPGHEQTPVAIVTGDYAMDERLADDLRSLGAQVHFKPLWLEDLLVLARTLLEVP
jgi:CheY-like chemotaxis protein